MFSRTTKTATKATNNTRLVVQSLNISQFSTSTENQADEKVGFIGLGNMGGHMANNLVQKGFDVVAFDTNQEAMDKIKAQGGNTASSPAEVAGQVDALVTMLPSNPHVQNVYGNDDYGIFKTVSKDTLLIDASTIDPNVAKQVASDAQEKTGAPMIDAPVSGGVGGAEAGTLTFMVGGSKENFDRAEPILSAMGQNLVHCGDNGSGQIAKVCNNLILGISMIGVSEGMLLGRTLGIDPSVLAGIINTSSGRCWSSDTYNPCPDVMEGVPASRGYTGGFGSDLMKKDLGLAISAAGTAKVPLPMGSLAHSLYEVLSANGYGGKDFSSVFEFMARDDKE